MNPRIQQIADFMRQEVPAYRAWPEGRLEAWLEWHWLDGRVGVITHRGQIVGVAIARLLDEAAKGSDPYAHTELGQIVWVDAIIIKHRGAMPLMLKQAQQRFGQRNSFCGTLFKRGGRITTIPWARIAKLKLHDYQHSGTA